MREGVREGGEAGGGTRAPRTHARGRVCIVNANSVDYRMRPRARAHGAGTGRQTRGTTHKR